MKPDGVRVELDKRKAFILSTIVYEYVATAEPVGSATLTQKYNLGVSSATIRNEMAELEAGGYLVQPHTSSGRVPSDAGYRTYVDQLMRPEQLAVDEQRRIRDELRAASRRLEEVIEHTTRLVGQLSRSVAFMVAPLGESHALRHLQLVWLSARTGLAVVVTSLGVAAQSYFEVANDLATDDLLRLSQVLNERLAGMTVHDALAADIASFVAAARVPSDLVGVVERALRAAGSSGGESLIASSGAQHLLDQPEFQDLRKLRSILRIVEEQKALYDIVADSVATGRPSVKIGQELVVEEMAECSVVTVPYRLGDEMLGVIAILGPRRMPYARLMALASGAADSLSEHFSSNEHR